MRTGQRSRQHNAGSVQVWDFHKLALLGREKSCLQLNKEQEGHIGALPRDVAEEVTFL